MTKEQLQGMLAEGFNLNQIAAIHMISRAELEKLLVETPVVKSTKKETPKVDIAPMFTEEEGL
jgi:hypothetical protein